MFDSVCGFHRRERSAHASIAAKNEATKRAGQLTRSAIEWLEGRVFLDASFPVHLESLDNSADAIPYRPQVSVSQAVRLKRTPFQGGASVPGVIQVENYD